MNRKFVYWMLPFLLIFIMMLSGCGLLKPPATLKSIKVEPSEAIVPTGGTVEFTATGYDQDGKAMTGITFQWLVQPANAGTIKNGVFTAGQEAGECTVICKAKGIVKEVKVTIVESESELTRIELEPVEITVLPEKTYQFTAKGYDQYQKEMAGIAFNWSVVPAEAGTITLDGLFTAGDKEGDCQVVCKVGEIEAKATVRIKQEPRKVVRIVVEPEEIYLKPGDTCQLTAQAYDQYGQEVTDFNFKWSVDKEEAGTIDESGLFTAGTETGEFEVICAAEEFEVRIPVQIFDNLDSYLQSVGEQFVADSQAAWANFIAAPRLSEILNNELVPGAGLAITVLNHMFNYVPMFEELENPYILYCYDPDDEPGGDYVNIDDLRQEREKHETLQTGTWKYYEEIYEYGEYIGTIYADITRETEGENDQITFQLRLEDEGVWIGSYIGHVSYPTANWYGFEPGETTHNDFIEFTINFELADGTNGYISGDNFMKETVYVEEVEDEWDSWYDEYSVVHEVGGGAEGEFTINDEKYSFAGELSLRFEAEEPDYFTGMISTPSAEINGRMELSYVEKPTQSDALFGGTSNVFPNKLTIDGSLKDKETALAANGVFKLELTNAASYDLSAPYSEENIPGIDLNFKGSLISENNDYLAGNLSFKEMDYKQFQLDVGYKLALDGVTRGIGLNAKTEDADKVAIVITSDWGAATMKMDLFFEPEFITSDDENGIAVGELSDVSGGLWVQGKKVGELVLGDNGVRVEYIDGSFETL